MAPESAQASLGLPAIDVEMLSTIDMLQTILMPTVAWIDFSGHKMSEHEVEDDMFPLSLFAINALDAVALSIAVEAEDAATEVATSSSYTIYYVIGGVLLVTGVVLAVTLSGKNHSDTGETDTSGNNGSACQDSSSVSEACFYGKWDYVSSVEYSDNSCAIQGSNADGGGNMILISMTFQDDSTLNVVQSCDDDTDDDCSDDGYTSTDTWKIVSLEGQDLLEVGTADEISKIIYTFTDDSNLTLKISMTYNPVACSDASDCDGYGGGPCHDGVCYMEDMNSTCSSDSECGLNGDGYCDTGFCNEKLTGCTEFILKKSTDDTDESDAI